MTALSSRQRHGLGVVCGVASGIWLGTAEAPMKLVAAGHSPFVISLGMVVGVFLARWTLPALIKGSDYVRADLGERPHLVAWGLVAGMLWAVANALTVFAIRDVGLAIAFPIWNLNSLVGVFWGWLLFGELRGTRSVSLRVIAGVVVLLAGGGLIAVAASQGSLAAADRTSAGVFAAMGAALLWGTMYVPYRKAYISGMNPLSFVAIFTIGELLTAIGLAVVFEGGVGPVLDEIAAARPALFWLFLGGFAWVLGDLFQQYAAKYLGIARGIPLSNTNQLWGLAWAVLVFGELRHLDATGQVAIVAGSLLMAAGAIAIGLNTPPDDELRSWQAAVRRECQRYDLDEARVLAALGGEDPLGREHTRRRLWEWVVAAVAVAIGTWLALYAEPQAIVVSPTWMIVLCGVALAALIAGGWLLWTRTRFA